MLEEDPRHLRNLDVTADHAVTGGLFFNFHSLAYVLLDVGGQWGASAEERGRVLNQEKKFWMEGNSPGRAGGIEADGGEGK